MTDADLCRELRTLDVNDAGHAVCVEAAKRIEQFVAAVDEAWKSAADDESLHDVLHKMQEEER